MFTLSGASPLTSGAIRVLLPPTAAHLAPRVLAAGCTPVIDATGEAVPGVPDGAWVRTRPGRPAPGTGPVVLAELGAPVPDRPTWLETSAPRDVPAGFAGLVLKGREAGGLCGEEDGLVALTRCNDPGRVLLDAGLGPRGAAAARALGAGGVFLVEPHLGCPEIALPPALARRLGLPDDEVTRLVHGLRICASATAPVLRRLTLGEHDPWTLASRVWQEGDPAQHLWLMGQGLALARGLADRHGTLPALLAAYREAWDGAEAGIRQARVGRALRTVGSAAALAEPDTAATVGGTVGASVLWEEATWVGRPLHGGPLQAMAAFGGEVVCEPSALEALQRSLPAPRPAAAPAPSPAPSPAPAPNVAAAPAVAPTAAPAIAIVGIGCRFPGGSTGPAAFWDNIVAGRYAIGPVPKDRWDAELFYDANPEVPDKTYSKIGGFLTDFVFDPKAFRIPPNVARQVDPVQQITLMCVADALRDAGLKVDKRAEGKDFDRERCAVILGNSLGGEMTDQYAIRLAWPDVAKKLLAVPPFCNLSADEQQKYLAQMEAAYKAGLPIVDEDSMPGELANVIAGRIANAFDLGGANFTVDAACASSMAAIDSAVKSLRDGESDLVITGGADRSMNIATYVKFCKIGALSPDHSAPFDASANGFVMGEGCGILVLKRYEDAVRDGDRVYAVIRGVGASSDGKGKGITAPNLNGQLRALRRAYEAAGIAPTDVDLVEAHGTSTVVGDKVEVEALTQVLGAGKRGDRGPVRIGSVKSMIGHLKSAAGAASVIKAALALHHGVLPPSINYRNARPDVPLDAVPLQVQTRAEPWPHAPDGLRRAGVSAFGFGGTNFHVVLESFAGQTLPASVASAPPARQPRPVPAAAPAAPAPAARIEAGDPRPVPPGAGLPDGVWAASGATRAELLANLEALRDGRQPAFQPSAALRIAAAPADAEERSSQIDRAITSVQKQANPDLLRARGVAYEDGPFDQKLVFVFTGQGSQYLNMGLDLVDAYPVVADTFAEADRVLTQPLGKPITEFIRLHDGEDEARKEDVLRQTEYSQPATLTIDVALLRLLAAYGVLPDIVAGHSLGEYGAAVAAGVMTFEQSLLAVSARGREMASIRIDDPGKMAGIATSTKVVDEVLADVDGYVIAANKNCPTQTVIAGASDAVDEACERFKAKGITVYQLPVSHAFHSRIVAPASDPLRGVLARLGLRAPRRPITTNVTGEYYPTHDGAVDGIIDLLAQQISAPVEWVAQMERMYEDGGRVFVEVGPKRALSGFTVSILKRRPHRSIYTNHPKRGGVASFRDALAQLLALGVPVRATPLASRDVDLFRAPEPRRATTQAQLAFAELHAPAAASGAPEPGTTEPAPDLQAGVLRIVAKSTGYDPAELDLDHELEADLGIDTVKQAGVFSVVRETYGIPADPTFRIADHRTLRSLIDWASSRTGARRLATDSSLPPPAAAPAPAAAGPVDADVIASFLTQAARAGVQGLDADAFARAVLPAVQALIAAAMQAAGAHTAPAAAPPAPAPARSAPPAPIAVRAPAGPAPSRLPGAPYPVDPGTTIVCSGTAIGLPGGDEVFGADNFVSMLTGRNRIDHIGDRARAFLDLGLVRLVKDPRTGQGSFLPVQRTDEVIRLAGIESRFDLRDWDIDADLIGALDVATRLAFAAGLEALRDAGIPLVRSYKTTASGKRVPQGWQLPPALRDGTGVVFGSAFPGYDMFARHLASGGRDAEGRFDRRFLFQVLAMGHSQFAQLIGARGPNTSVNAACASSTQALAIAEDWIRCGRCERVIVVGADDVTSDALLPWIGGGFMAAGAATTHDVVEQAALPFDRRRHGLILGMGAVGIVVESEASCRTRGVVPLARQLAAVSVNSAFHGTRLDVDHIAGVLQRMVADVCAAEGVTPAEMARDAFFMSHETYTPARGGSAAAEIEALRAAFGPAARQIVVTNTKGYTGHPMGAGIEDGVVLKALQYGVVPPVANLAEPDEQLGDLTLSSGERRRFKYAIRLAAGFGSQLALTLLRAEAVDDDRLADRDARVRWLREVTGYGHVAERIEHRTLRAVESEVDAPYDLRPDVSPAPYGASGTAASPRPAARTTPPLHTSTVPVPAPAPAAPAPAPKPAAPAAGGAPAFETVLSELVAVVAAKTGYDPSEIEPEFELEADLGVDTVKQAEILGELTDRYGLEQDDGFRVADYPTLTALAGYLMGRVAGAGTAAVPGTATAAPPREHQPEPHARTVPPSVPPEPAPARAVTAPTMVPPEPRTHAPSAGGGADDALQDLLAVVAAKTGYDTNELEPDFELEADLGIDTVKQAEILSELTDRYGLPQDDTFRLSDHPTIRALSVYLSERRGSAGGAVRDDDTASERLPEVAPEDELERTESSSLSVSPALAPEAPTPRGAPTRAATPAPARPTPRRADSGAVSFDDTMAQLVAVVAEKTGYEPSDLEPSFELEADLGVDTVKQAEILGELTERFELPRDEAFRPADHPTLEALGQYLHQARLGAGAATADLVEDTADDPTHRTDLEPTPDPTPAKAALSDLPFVAEEFDLSVGMSTEERVRANHVPLPPTFRVRRPVLDRRGPVRSEDLEAYRVLVLGETPLAAALRHEVAVRGGAEGAPYDVIIDAADDLMGTFRRARTLDGQRPARWITVTRLGGMSVGDFGIPRAFVDGGRAGFTKALGREWAGMQATVLDVHPVFPPADVARIVCDEISVVDGDREVFVDPDGARWAIRLEAVELPEPTALEGRPVVLLTGGGRGITARVATELARAGAGAVALVGRSPVSDHPLDEVAAKQQIRAQLQLAGERVTPARVEAALAGLRRTEEVRRTLESLRELGLNVRYFQADLADAAQAARVVDSVLAEFGTLDVVVHGAGVEESRQLKDKDDTGFHRVFDGKAVGGRALIERLPPTTYLLCMGSVAGRFGNPGQVDYAAANDALARICQTRPASLQVDWTAWDDVGMAVRGGMRSLLTDRGVELLPADAGAALVVSLVAARVEGELVVAGRLGDFEPGPTHPLLDTIEVGDGKARSTRAMSRTTDPWIADHAIEGVPVLPGVIGLECMAATAATLMPDRVFRGARNVRFSAPVKMHRDAPTTLVVEAQIVSVAEVHATLVSERKLATGRVQRTEHFEASLVFDEPSTGWMIDGLPSVFLPDEEVDQPAIYRRFFHGPAFRVLSSVFGVSADGLVGEGRVDHGPLGGDRLLTAPLVLEVAFQAAGLHRMIVTHTMGLPFELEEVQLYRRPDPEAPLAVTVELDGAYPTGGRYNVDVDAVDGPILRLRGFSMVERGPVPPHDRFPEPDGGRSVCFPAGLRHTVVRGTTIAEAHADEDWRPWLSTDELEELQSRGTDKRVADRVAGRIAAKRALSELTGVDPLAIRIWTAASGQPVARVPGHPSVRVSISHRDARAVAVAVSTGRVGVDLERIETRPESFGRTWFRDDERALVADPERQTVAWAVKEAVLKWLGTGLRASPHDVRVTEIGEGTARVALSGASAELHARLGGDPLEVTWSRDRVGNGPDEVIVTVRSAA